MKTLTKILSVTALLVLCVCLFTLTAFAETIIVTKIVPKEPATCATPGNERYLLTDKGEYYLDPNSESGLGELNLANAPNVVKSSKDGVEIPATGHSFGAKQTSGGTDCTDMGYEWYECTNTCCAGKFYQDNGKYTTNEGKKQTGYGAHVKGEQVYTQRAADCCSNGYYNGWKCSVCQALIDDNDQERDQSFFIIPKNENGHRWELVDSKPATEVSPGYNKYICLNDTSHTKTELIDGGPIVSSTTDIYNVIASKDTWQKGEEPLTFWSDLIAELNDRSGPNANYVGVRYGQSSLYENSIGTFDFWSWDEYIKLGEKVMNSMRPGHYYLWVYDVQHPNVYTNSCEFWVLETAYLEPYSTDKHVVNSSKSLRFIASEEIDPSSVMVGSRRLYDSNDFFVSNDRKNITLSPDFLNARQTGTYTISALTKGGQTIKTNFYILSTAQASSSPRTGDESQIGLWAAFLLLSGAAIVVMVPKLRKNGVK